MPSRPLDPAARARERSLLVGGISDAVLVFVFLAVGVWANALMMIAEGVRGGLLVGLEMILLLLLRRIHRGRTHAFDYGAGKLEQFANAGIGTAMGVAGLWIGATAVQRWWVPEEQQSVGLVISAALGAVNMVQNGYVFRQLWKAGRDGASLIVTGQVRTRLAKLMSSGLVLVALCVNAIFGDGLIGRAAEVLGSLFVALVMLQLAVSMWRQALPSLLDRTLEEGQQHLINRALVSHFDDYDQLISVRSRLSGNTPIVEIALAFNPERTIGEVQGVVDRVKDEVAALIPGAAVTVMPTAA